MELNREELKIISFKHSDSELFNQAWSIRKTVFIEEQGVDPEIENEKEDVSNHYLIYKDDNAVGTARWRETESGIKLERFAILSEYRSYGIGSVLLNHILADLGNRVGEAYLHAQVRVINYYKRAGFSEFGDRFIEADIEHIKMKYCGKA